MKDYSMNLFERQLFILNYDKYEDHIVVNFASGLKMYVEYTKEAEEEILNVMRMQVLNTDKLTKECISNFKTFVIPLSIIGYGPLRLTFSQIQNMIANNEDPTYYMVMSALCLSLGLSQTIKGIKYYNLLKDIDKNYLFLENEYHINYHMRVEDKYLEGLSRTARDIIIKNKDEDNIFTFNTIDKMSYRDIKKVLENINNNIEDNNSKIRKRRR